MFRKSTNTPESAQKMSPELEMAQWFKAVRKDGMKFTQKELSEKTSVPLSTIRHFEQTGQIGFPAFIRIAKELYLLDLFLAHARNEEAETFHKIQKEKTISRLKDALDMATGMATPIEIRNRNSAADPRFLGKITHWRMAGKTKWNPTCNGVEPNPSDLGRHSNAR